jgi:hypothetical protein
MRMLSVKEQGLGLCSTPGRNIGFMIQSCQFRKGKPIIGNDYSSGTSQEAQIEALIISHTEFINQLQCEVVYKHMQGFEDYTIHNGIGIRVRENRSCRVIRLVKGQWIEIGVEYSFPIDPNTLAWTATGIPATMLAVALRVYELDHPTSTLRGILSGKAAAEKRRDNSPVSRSSGRYQFATAK